MTELDRRPTRLATAVSLVTAVGAVATTVSTPIPATVVAGAGALLFASALVIGSRRLLDLGALGVIVGIAISASATTPAWPLVGTIATIVAWDVGATAITLGRQLGRQASTSRLELWYIISSTSVGTAAGVIAYGVFRLTHGITLDALTIILFVGICATLALGARFGWNESIARR